MKKNRVLIGLMSLLVVSLAGALFATCGVSLVDMLTGGAVMLGSIAPIVGGTVTTQAAGASPELLDNYISSKIVQMRPAMTPIDTIMRKVDARKIDSFVYEYYKVDTKSVNDTVLTAYTSAGDGLEQAVFVPSNPELWSVDETIFVPSLPGRDGKGAFLYINAINRANGQVTVQALNGADGAGTMAGKRIVPSLAATTKIYRCAKAGAELDMQTTPYAMLPIKDDNFAQIFMAQVEESTYQKMHRKEVDWGFSDYEALNIYDMRLTMEASFLWGYKHNFIDKADNQQKYTTGGIMRNITKGLEYGTGTTNRTVSKTQYIDWTKQIFTGNSGSEKRILFYGGTLGASLHELEEVQKQLQAGNTEVVHGITFKKLVTNFGILLLYYHPIFSLYGYDDYGLVLDINNVEKFEFKPMQIEQLDLKGSGQRNVQASFLSEASGMALKYADTHAIIKPKA